MERWIRYGGILNGPDSNMTRVSAPESRCEDKEAWLTLYTRQQALERFRRVVGVTSRFVPRIFGYTSRLWKLNTLRLFPSLSE